MFVTQEQKLMLPVDFAKKHCLSLKPDKGVQPGHTPVRCEGVTDVNINPRRQAK